VNRRTPESWASLSAADLFRSVRSRLPSVVITAFLVTAVIVAMLMAWPNQYRSDGLMYVRLGRGALGIDPTASPTKSVSLQESRISEVVSIGEMIRSREIARRVAEQIGVDEILKPRTWIDRSMVRLREKLPESEATWGDMTAEECRRQLVQEQAIEKIQHSLSIGMHRNGYTVSVGAKSTDPILARQITQAVMDQYGRYHVEAHRADGSFEFFQELVEASRRKAAAAQQALQKSKSELGWMSPETAEKTLGERVVSLEVALHETAGQLAQAESKATELATLIASVDQWVPVEITSGIANEAADEMRGQLYELQVEDSDAMAKIMPNHPRYRMLREKLNSSSEIVKLEDADREERREAINPVFQELQTTYTATLAEAAGLKSRHDALTQGLAEARAEVKRLNSEAAGLAELAWAADIAQRDYLEHTRRFDEARITHDLDTENLSDVSVIQDASLNLKKSSPSRALLAIIGAMLGLSLGLLQAILRGSGGVSVSPRPIPSGDPVRNRIGLEPRRHDDRFPTAAQVAGSPEDAVAVGFEHQDYAAATVGASEVGRESNGRPTDARASNNGHVDPNLPR